MIDYKKLLLTILITFVFSSSFASTGESIQGTLGPDGNYISWGKNFLTPHIPYTIICKITNKNDEVAYANISPGGTKQAKWKSIRMNGKVMPNFESIITIKPRTTTVVKVTGFELKKFTNNAFFSVQNLGYRFSSQVDIYVKCTSTIE